MQRAQLTAKSRMSKGSAMPADLILYGGDIITMEGSEANPGSRGADSPPKTEAVAISGDTILAVGSIDVVFRHAGPDTQVIFLNQQTLMPGFIEPHQHAIQCALMRSQYINISALNYRCYDDIHTVMVNRISELDADPNNKDWAIFFGWDPELISDLPTLSADFLDANFSSTIPIVVVGQSGHVAWVNSPALAAPEPPIGQNYPSPSGGTVVLDAEGWPTGQVFEEPAIMLVMGRAPLPDEELMMQGFYDQWRAYASAGLTTVTELAYMPSPEMDAILKTCADAPDFPIRLGLYKMTHAQTEEELHQPKSAPPPPKVRCCSQLGRVQPAPPKKGRSVVKNYDGGVGNYSSRLWEAGLKLVADGSPHCGTCATREPFMYTPLTETLGFPKAPGYGTLNMEDDALLDTIKRHHQDGKQMAIHCHGERSSEQVLKVYEQVLNQFPNQDNRHRMEHLGLMTVDQIERAGKINLALSFFVDHLRFYALVYKTDIFGDRVNRWTPLSEATKNGITWTIHQDHPTFPGDANPFANMKTAITRCTRDDPTTPYGPEYRVSIHEVLKSYTVNAAWQLHLDQKVGSIKPGKKADLVILSDNPYDVDPFDLEKIRVIETFVDGRRNNLANIKTIPTVNVKVLDRPV
ncbi:N-substituted formamide deformylase-like [Patiria miniata]|uniref:Amidohydrolase 3 domain-containing protein n=1 Tax=Patiria miniata TaxID=46514 RepID=A0A914AXY3_PATMI|nr:N-substituted formamide deformylase-like [Patiria miniata]XP_038068561.1 N-substituted formamide deformylase-like [Patiria miniata]